MENENLKSLFASLDGILQNTDLSDVTADSNDFAELPDGYYLCEVEKAELKESKTSKQPMVAFQFKIVEDGTGVASDGTFTTLKKTKNRKVFLYYVLKDERSVRRFATDMLKFEGEKEGEPLLGKEYFMNSEILEEALDVLTGSRIYIQSSTTENEDGSNSVWKNMISWKRAKALELDV